MDALRAFENGSLLSSYSAPARWDPFRRPLESIQPWQFSLLAAVMLVVTSLSLAENLAVILVTFKFKQLRQPVNYIIVNLSVADFLVSLTGGTISFLANLKGFFFMGHWACVLEGFAVTFFGVAALWSLALLALERYIVICRPPRNTRLRGRQAALAIVFVWSFSFIWTIPPTAGWSSYTTSKIGTTCEPNWYSGAYADRAYIIAFFTTCFIVPLLVILVSYGKLLQKLKKVSDAQGRLGATRRPERQVTRMVVFMIVAFLICWMPYAAFSLLVTVCPSIELDPCLAAIPAFFSKTATVYNPIIYVFMNKQFRQCLIQMFSCSAIGTGKSNMNLTSEGAVLTQDRRGTEMSPMAALSTISTRKTADEHGRQQSLALLTTSENKMCPM
ncbi:PREDICTED: vertebrate ancient opsin-like [Ficedula albicollis]|uniref:vertebrate ancient opsin-like n=1 Tax=Ficedula albicollis TaxID=59894 RepID=UPI0003599F37|nr:PREDICTED: vertebrate ancient opsin-like [Ficedula albicollis]